jgi:cysteinyl-tRNA synthetase
VGTTRPKVISNQRVQRLIELRIKARSSQAFSEADAIRQKLMDHGIVLEDRPDGTTDWRRA